MTELFALHEVQQPGRSVAHVLRPTTVVEALRLLFADARAQPIAGGTDLLLELERGAPGDPVPVVDLTSIEGFRSIDEEDDSFILGGGVTHNQIVRDVGLRSAALPLAQACAEIGSPQLRNRATIAGNLVTASPANDTISSLMALDADLVLSRLTDDVVENRVVRVIDFFLGFRETVLAPGELITSIRVPKLAADERGIWVKLGLRKAQAISVVHAGIVVGLDGDVVSSARLAIGSVAPTVVMIHQFSEALVGHPLDDATIDRAAEVAAAAVSPIDDVRATAEYRGEAVRTLVDRALHALADDSQESMWLDDPPTLSTSDQLLCAAPVVRARVDDEMTVRLNGTELTRPGARRTLLDWIRDEAGLTGMKEGCAEGECGACTVVLDGKAVMSCLVAAGQADGSDIVTVEGLADGGQLHPIQQCFVNDFAVQCGFCIPGFLVAGARLLEENPVPSDDQIRLGLSGNLCRCTGYYPILEAVRNAGGQMQNGAPS